jgi:coenzyme PQQ precursor peptide PqqA
VLATRGRHWVANKPSLGTQRFGCTTGEMKAPVDTFGMDLALTRGPLRRCGFLSNVLFKETAMQWTTPAYTDLRFGFEITMYIATR